ncbi:MAG: methionine--tRNA ligase [Candidatus Woesearchaeota archaeon]
MTTPTPANQNIVKKYLVTSALPYVNNVPHLGNLVCVISADVYTRFLRLKKEQVISVLGTDEHGTTSETKAIEEGLTTKELCDKYEKIHKEIYDWFECDFDCYGRTSSLQNAEVTIDIFNKLHENGFIAEETLEQLYCESCARFLADRFVEGVCPKCAYTNARGDQCESCGALLDAHELINPQCKVCKGTPLVKESTHLFIDLPKLEPQLREWISRVEKQWSDNARTMTHAWLKEGLRKRCITRDLKWGIHVPLKGFEDKVFYSWFDAPIGYIGITKENRADWKEWWFTPEHTHLVQFMGKDNIPFHTILFPSFLIGTEEPYTLMSEISVNEFLNYEGGQFSKSRNLGVFGDDAKSTGIPADVYRYYLMINRPEKMDTEFSWDDFRIKNNSELVGNLGNLVNRTTVFLGKNFASTIPKAVLTAREETLLAAIKTIEQKATKLLYAIDLKEALKEIMSISRLANQYLQECEPWKNPDAERNATCFFMLANIVKDLSILISPYMPMAAQSIREQLHIPPHDWDDLGVLSVEAGHHIHDATLLFKKIEDKEIQEFRKMFSGVKQSKSASAKKSATAKTSATTAGATHALPNVVHSLDPFDHIQLRVAKIVGVTKHPKAEKLYIEEIDFGDEQRTIVSGLVQYYTAEELLGRKIIVVTNLEPAKLRGVESNGMLLAAEENNVVGLLEPQGEVGEYIYRSGDASKIDIIQSLPKINLDQFLKAKIMVKDSTVLYNDVELYSSGGPIRVDRVSNGIVR